jgi:hypothetical protein
MAKSNLNNIKEINEQIRLLKKELGQVDFEAFGAGQFEEATTELKNLRRELNAINSDIDYFGKSLGDSIQELQKSNYALSVSKKSFKSLIGISEDFTSVLSGQAILSKKEIKEKKILAELEFKRLKQAIASGTLEENQLTEIQGRVAQEQEYLKALDKVIDFQNEITSKAGTKLFGGLEEISNAIPGLNKFTSAFTDAADAAREADTDNVIEANLDKEYQAKLKQRELDKEALKTGKGLSEEAIKRLGLEDKLLDKNGKLLKGKAASIKGKKIGIGEKDMSVISKGAGTGISGLMKGIKTLGKSLMKSLGPLYLLKELVDAMKGVDAEASKMAKSFGMTYKESLKMQKEFTQIAVSSGEIFVNTKGIRETFTAINSSLGTNSMLSNEMAISFTKLREMSGFTNEELQGIARLQLGTTKSTEEITGQFLAQAKVSAIQNGVKLNEQKLLKDINKVSAATTLSLGKNPGLIAKSVATAKSLGMELSQIEAIAGSLLNFEDSISSEMEAELLTGKELNLEKARTAALNGDLATVAKEIANQVGDSADFSKMNRIQQEALAKSVGMSREDLAETLLLQDELTGLTADDAAEATKKFNMLKAQVGEAEAMRVLQEEGIDQLNHQVGVQDKFNATVEKLKEVFVTVANAIMPIVDIIADVFGLVGSIMKFLDPMIQTVLVGVAAVQDLLSGIGWLFGADFGDSAIKAQIQTAEQSAQDNYGVSGDAFGEDWSIKDRTAMADGGIVTGPTNALVGEAGPEAVIPLSDNSPVIKQANETNTLLKQLIQAVTEGGNVYLDGTKVGTAMSVSNYKMQ